MRNQPPTLLTTFLVLLISSLLTGCTVKQAVEDLRTTEFLNYQALQPTKVTPFDRAWIAPNIAAGVYESLIVDAVRTDFVKPDNWIFSAGTFMPTRESYLAKVNKLADYIQHAVTDRFAEGEEKDPQVAVKRAPAHEPIQGEVEKLAAPKPQRRDPIEPLNPGPRTLHVQISIVEADFGDPLIYAGLLAVPVPAAANISTAVKSPSLTLEARLVDQESGEIKMALIDRRFPQLKIVDVNRLTVSSALHEIADSFADDLVRSLYRKPDHVIGKRWPFSLVPW